LSALANKYGTKANGAVILDPPFPRQTMAEILGVSIETLLRSLKRFRERKLLTTSQSRITLIDDARLRETARTSPFYLSIIEETY
jgi:CRP-like cAMP-binding protein